MKSTLARLSITEKARQLRSQMTDAEQRLWHRLRGRQLGAQFRRQYPVGPYIADFACIRLALIIELDGGQHADAEAYDRQRDAWMRSRGFNVLRFWNHEVLGDMDAVLGVIYREIDRTGRRFSPS